MSNTTFSRVDFPTASSPHKCLLSPQKVSMHIWSMKSNIFQFVIIFPKKQSRQVSQCKNSYRWLSFVLVNVINYNSVKQTKILKVILLLQIQETLNPEFLSLDLIELSLGHLSSFFSFGVRAYDGKKKFRPSALLLTRSTFNQSQNRRPIKCYFIG